MTLRQIPRVPIPEEAREEELPLARIDQYPRLAGLYRYWDTKRGNRRMPARREISPEEMRDFLGFIILVDVESGPPRRFRFRLVGSEISNAYGRDLTGSYVEDATPESYRKLIERHYSQAVDRAQPVVHRLTFVEWPGKRHALVRLILPLSDDNATVNMLLMVSVFGQELAIEPDNHRPGSGRTT